MTFPPKSPDQMASPGGGATPLGGGETISGGGTSDTGRGTSFWLNLITVQCSDTMNLMLHSTWPSYAQTYTTLTTIFRISLLSISIFQ